MIIDVKMNKINLFPVLIHLLVLLLHAYLTMQQNTQASSLMDPIMSTSTFESRKTMWIIGGQHFYSISNGYQECIFPLITFANITCFSASYLKIEANFEYSGKLKIFFKYIV